MVLELEFIGLIFVLLVVFFGGKPNDYLLPLPFEMVRFYEDLSFVSFFLLLDSDRSVANALAVFKVDSDGGISEGQTAAYPACYYCFDREELCYKISGCLREASLFIEIEVSIRLPYLVTRFLVSEDF